MNFNRAEGEKLWERIYEKDVFTGEHCRRVSEMAGEFARYMQWDENEIETLQIAGLIHDLGKLELADAVFDKLIKGEALSKEDTHAVREHTGHIRQLAGFENIPQLVVDVLKYHHEKFGGSGYPHGLLGDEIPKGVRLITLVDYYDTIVEQRPWKTPDLQKPLGVEDAVKLLIEESVTRLDPEMVPKFINMILKKSPKTAAGIGEK